jgi:hypothetical protein
VWRVLAAPRPIREFINASAAAARRERKLKRAQRKRALLVGINDYPDPRHRLEGCVNDVFLMSSVLQELDFSPEQIRVVLNDRATAEGIRSRLQWLLEGAADGDQLVFYYSGHGIRLPAYGAAGIVDRIHECLVPHDFDGSLESAVSDEHICGLYSQLPYETFFAMVLDCCHSGGVSRSGGPRARGLDPPDDIRHRMLYWDRKLQMWRERKFEPLAAEADEQRDRRFAGDGASFRLGRAIPFRQLSGRDYRAVQAERNNRGPYMPVVLEACRADELAFEYRHGGTSYGAFTYVLAKALRQAGREQRRQLTYRQLVEAAARELKDELGYDQTSSLAGPSQILDSRIPWKQ